MSAFDYKAGISDQRDWTQKLNLQTSRQDFIKVVMSQLYSHCPSPRLHYC